MTPTTTGKSELVTALGPILDHLAQHGATASAASLQTEFPLDGPLLKTVRRLVLDGLDAGWLTPREANGVRFGRVAKSRPESHNFTVDAVDMDGPGPGHTHPEGEFDLCFALTPDARFDGAPEGWVVYPPGSWHIPTVSNGRMVILYFLPDGAIRFEPKPA